MGRVLLVVLFLSALSFAGGFYVRGMSAISFTKVCKDIDSTHCKCDGVIITHSPELEYSKDKPASRVYRCRED